MIKAKRIKVPKRFRRFIPLACAGAVLLVGLLIWANPLLDLAGLLPTKAGSARIYLSGLAEETYINQVGELEIHVVSEHNAINAAAVSLKVNPSMVEILSMSTEESFCSLYLENNFDPRKGEAHVSCGTPTPGFSGDSVLMKIRVRYKLPGKTEFRLEPADAMVLANTGGGTDILDKRLPMQQIYIKQTL